MKYITISLLFLITIYDLSAQKPSDYLKKVPRQDGALYFLKPQKFVTNSREVQFEADFTFNYDKHNPGKGMVINFSMFTKSPVKKINGLTVKKNTPPAVIYTTDSAERFYCEKGKVKWDNRFSCIISPESLLDILSDIDHYSILVSYDNNKFEAQFPAKLKKDLEAVGQSIQIETGINPK